MNIVQVEELQKLTNNVEFAKFLRDFNSVRVEPVITFLKKLKEVNPEAFKDEKALIEKLKYYVYSSENPTLDFIVHNEEFLKNFCMYTVADFHELTVLSSKTLAPKFLNNPHILALPPYWVFSLTKMYLNSEDKADALDILLNEDLLASNRDIGQIEEFLEHLGTIGTKEIILNKNLLKSDYDNHLWFLNTYEGAEEPVKKYWLAILHNDFFASQNCACLESLSDYLTELNNKGYLEELLNLDEDYGLLIYQGVLNNPTVQEKFGICLYIDLLKYAMTWHLRSNSKAIEALLNKNLLANLTLDDMHNLLRFLNTHPEQTIEAIEVIAKADENPQVRYNDIRIALDEIGYTATIETLYDNASSIADIVNVLKENSFSSCDEIEIVTKIKIPEKLNK